MNVKLNKDGVEKNRAINKKIKDMVRKLIT